MIEESIDDRLMTWIVDLSDWNPSEMEFDSIIDLFPIEIAHKVRSYHHRIDAKRSLVGTLLVQSIVYHTYSIAWQDIRFSKNSYGKPYLVSTLNLGRSSLLLSPSTSFGFFLSIVTLSSLKIIIFRLISSPHSHLLELNMASASTSLTIPIWSSVVSSFEPAVIDEEVGVLALHRAMTTTSPLLLIPSRSGSISWPVDYPATSGKSMGS